MKLEVGKSYRTRGGWRADVLRDDRSESMQFEVLHHDDMETRWQELNGKCPPDIEKRDLISEWQDDAVTETLRDRMAMAALTGMLANSKFEYEGGQSIGGSKQPEAIVLMAYQYADAMLVARENKQ